MTFSANTIPVAQGSLSSADYVDGTVRVIVSGGSSCRLYRYDTVRRIKSGGETVSYSDDCALVPGGKIERRGNVYYVAT